MDLPGGDLVVASRAETDNRLGESRFCFLGRVAGLCLAAVLGLASASWAIRVAAYQTSYKNTDALAEDVRLVLSDPAVDTLFIGSSRTLWMVDPERFDEDMKTAGYATHSYVAGVPALSIPEIRPIIDGVLNGHPCCLKRVIIEPDFAALTPITSVNVSSSRGIHLLSPTNVLRMLFYISSLSSDMPEPSRAMMVLDTLNSATRRFLNIGLVYRSGDLNFLDPAALYPRKRGYAGPLVHRDPDLDKPETAMRYKNDVKAMTEIYERQTILPYVTNSQWDYFARDVRFLIDQDIEVIILHSPQWAHWSYGLSYVMRYLYDGLCIPGAALFDLGNPIKYGDLFDLNFHIDFDHLNEAGVERYTDAIAAKMTDNLAHGAGYECGMK